MSELIQDESDSNNVYAIQAKAQCKRRTTWCSCERTTEYSIQVCRGCSKSASSVRPDRAFGHCNFCHGYLPRRSVSAILRVLGFSDPLKQQPKTTRPKRLGLWDARLPDFFVVPVTVEQYEELETSHIGIMRRPRGHAYAHWCSYLHSTEQTRERVQKQWQLWVAPEGEATCFEFHTFLTLYCFRQIAPYP